MKNIIGIVWIAAIGMLQACNSSNGKESQANTVSERIPVRVLQINRSEVQNAVSAAGQFSTDDETFLSFKTGGVIERVFVKEGDAIRKDQLLATLDLTEVDAGVTQAKLGYEKAKRDFERVTNLYKDSVATLEQYQNAKTGLEVASTHYEAAKFNRSYSEIRALGNGYVLKKLANTGQVIGPGVPVFQTNGARKGSWILKTGVSDKVWAQISVGDKATITTDAAPGTSYPASVVRKSEGTDPYTGLFTVELKLSEKTPSSIASGMFGRAVITPGKTQDVWSIPYDALLDADAKSGFVFITDDSANARKVPVTIASIERDQVLVAGGLEDAKAIIVSGSAYLRDGSPIEILK